MALYQVNAGDRILAADVNQFYAILKGVAASGEAVTLVYNAAAAAVLQPSSDPAAGTEAIQIKNNAGTVQSALSFDGRFYPADGLVGTPGIAFESNKNTGLYRVSANRLALVGGGAETWGVDATTLYARGVAAEVLAYDRWEWYWTPALLIESTLTGTGSYTPSTTNTSASLVTGATSGSTVGLRSVGGMLDGGVSGIGTLKRWSFTADLVSIDANTTAYIFLTDENVTGAPSLTARHLGIKNVAGVVSFSTADNTTEQATNVSAFVSASTGYQFTITFDGTTARLYVNGVLRATHATNVPSIVVTNPVYRVYITNNAASTKQLSIGRMTVSLAIA